MKRLFSLLLIALVLLSLSSCGGRGRREPAAGDDGTGWTVRIENESGIRLHSIAVRFSADGTALGSKVSDRIDEKAQPTVYEFDFTPGELSGGSIGVFRLDVYAAESAGEDYSPCGCALIDAPGPGAVYTLSLQGDDPAGLALFSADPGVTILSVDD